MYKHILIATDGSELAGKAVATGLALAKRLGAKVTAVTAIEPWISIASSDTAAAFMEYQRAAERLVAPHLIWLPTTILAVHDGPPSRGARGIQVGIGVFNRRRQSSIKAHDWSRRLVSKRTRPGGVAIDGCRTVGEHGRRDSSGHGRKTVDVGRMRDVAAHRGSTVGEYGRRHVTQRGCSPVAVYATWRVTWRVTGDASSPVAIRARCRVAGDARATKDTCIVDPAALPRATFRPTKPLRDAFDAGAGRSV